jgi:hypothetical protein
VTSAPTTTILQIDSVQRFGIGKQPTTIVVTFNAALNPSSAEDVGNYSLFLVKKRKHSHTPSETRVAIASAVYDPTTMTVTLTPAKKLKTPGPYSLTVSGTGLTGLNGNLLAGSNGTPGTNYTTIPAVEPLVALCRSCHHEPEGPDRCSCHTGTIGLNPFSQPVHLQYSVHGGTGAFRHATGTGLVDLSLYQAIPTNLAQLKQMGVQIDTVGVRFALDFHRGHLDQWGNFAGMWYGIIESLVKKSDGPPTHHAGHKSKE